MKKSVFGKNLKLPLVIDGPAASSEVRFQKVLPRRRKRGVATRDVIGFVGYINCIQQLLDGVVVTTSVPGQQAGSSAELGSARRAFERS